MQVDFVYVNHSANMYPSFRNSPDAHRQRSISVFDTFILVGLIAGVVSCWNLLKWGWLLGGGGYEIDEAVVIVLGFTCCFATFFCANEYSYGRNTLLTSSATCVFGIISALLAHVAKRFAE